MADLEGGTGGRSPLLFIKVAPPFFEAITHMKIGRHFWSQFEFIYTYLVPRYHLLSMGSLIVSPVRMYSGDTMV